MHCEPLVKYVYAIAMSGDLFGSSPVSWDSEKEASAITDIPKLYLIQD